MSACLLMLMATTSTTRAFQLSTRPHWIRSNNSAPTSSWTTHLTHYRPSTTCRSTQLRLQEGGFDDGDEEDDAVIDFFVSPEQIALLRKEASKREARNKLPRYNLSTSQQEDVNMEDLSDETIDAISQLFEQSELIEVRGVSKNSKRKVYEMAQTLASTLENIYEIPVVVVEIKGFAVKLYRPWSEEDDNETMREGLIQLRTNYKPGQWTRKAKPIRDFRGQIITDEFGNSVKEVPED
ncbi:hypothetical protein ACHAXH_008424 [Discostella pseudostelligera]